MFLSSNEQWHKKCWGKGYQFGIYNFLCCKTAKSPQKWKGHYINNVLLLSLGSLRWGEVFQDRLLELFYFRVRDRISKVPIKRFRKFLKGHPLRVHLCYKECCSRTLLPPLLPHDSLDLPLCNSPLVCLDPWRVHCWLHPMIHPVSGLPESQSNVVDLPGKYDPAAVSCIQGIGHLLPKVTSPHQPQQECWEEGDQVGFAHNLIRGE